MKKCQLCKSKVAYVFDVNSYHCSNDNCKISSVLFSKEEWEKRKKSGGYFMQLAIGIGIGLILGVCATFFALAPCRSGADFDKKTFTKLINREERGRRIEELG